MRTTRFQSSPVAAADPWSIAASAPPISGPFACFLEEVGMSGDPVAEEILEELVLNELDKITRPSRAGRSGGIL